MMLDLWPPRVLRHVLRPGEKYGAGSRTLDYLRLAVAPKHKTVLVATFPKSGWNWTAEVLDYCVTRHFTGRYEVTYSGEGTLKQRQKTPPSVFSPADSRSSRRPTVRALFPEVDLDYCLHTHSGWHQSPLAGLDAAKTVLVVRSIPTTLYSYFRSRRGKFATLQDCLDDGALDRILRFYNSWGDFCARPSARFRVFRYEDMRREPVKQFRAMFEYVFGFDVGEVIVAEALDFYSFEKQKEREWRFSGDENRHFHFRGALDYRDMIDPATMVNIRRALAERLRHDFGYDYAETVRSGAVSA